MLYEVITGNTWRTFPMKNQTSVRSVCFAHDGRFYATSFNEFGFFKKESNGNYAYESLSGAVENSKIGSNDLFKIIQGNKSIYFQSDKTIFEYVITAYSIHYTKLYDKRVFSVLELLDIGYNFAERTFVRHSYPRCTWHAPTFIVRARSF